MTLNDFAEMLRQQCNHDLNETGETTNLTLTQSEFDAKVLSEENGTALLDLYKRGECRICERLGLVRIEQMGIVIPRWKNLIAHLRIVESV